jgi:integrase
MPYTRIVRGREQIKVDVPPRLRHLVTGKSGQPVAALTEFVGTRRASTIIDDFLARIEVAEHRLNGGEWVSRALDHEIGMLRDKQTAARRRLDLEDAVLKRVMARFASGMVPDLVITPEPVETHVVNMTCGVVPYTEIIELWVDYRRGKKGKQTSTVTLDRVRSKMDRLFGYLGHGDMAKVTDADLHRYVEKVLLAKQPDGKYLGPGALRDHIIYIKALFNLAYKKKRITSDPSAELEYEKNTGETREDFTEEERATIITAARNETDPLLRHGNLLGVFHGMRVAEFAEAHKEDIQIEDGVPVFFIDTRHRVGPEKVLKTKKSKRWVTLHSAMRDDFMTYVDSLPPGSYLFPNLTPYKGRRNKDASNRLGRWLHKLGIGFLPDGKTPDPQKSFHSHRHTVKTMLETNGVPDRLSDFITGHAGPAAVAKKYLHRHVHEVEAAIEGITDPSINKEYEAKQSVV